jgi:Casein kinase II regulatory subunit
MDFSPRRSKLQLVSQWRESVGLTPFSHLASSTPTSSLTWITWFCSLPGHEYFSEVSEDFIEDDFNLTGLNSMVPFWKEAMEMVLDVEPGGFTRFMAHVEQSELIAFFTRFAHRRGFSQNPRRLYRGGFSRTAVWARAPTLHFDTSRTRGHGLY